ncbi:ribonuclease toxin immunity protein CdiI [Gilliamella apicola]|uniref:ribonuclease toxin immunity protein CdiI n=1 Tax=Gilliamella apicola TaxID=1196095 RepID=UPI001C652BC1|nr:ribonuclease toxin immunity protein CdiI [Gilliamella apicola]
MTLYNDGYFLIIVESIINSESFMLDGVYCNFPDMNCYDESELFEGVEFAIGYLQQKMVRSLLVKVLVITMFV